MIFCSSKIVTRQSTAASSKRFFSLFVLFVLVFNSFAQASNLAGKNAASLSKLTSMPPNVNFNGLRHYSRLKSIVPISVTATDDIGVSRIELYVDQNLFATSNVYPNAIETTVSFNLDTALLTNGKHMLQAKAYDSSGNSQTATRTVITINALRSAPLPTASISVSPAFISNGQSAVLSWNTTNASSVTIDQGIGTVASSGSRTVSPTATTVYTLTATNAAGSTARTAALTVSTPPVGDVISLLSDVKHQTMDGWEVTDQAGQLYSPAWNNYKNPLLDQAVNDLGINRVRVEIFSNTENPTDYFTQWRTGQITESQYNDKRFEIINDNSNASSINPNGFKWAQIDHSIDNLVLPLRQRLQARGESLWISVNYVDFEESAFEHKNFPAEYAEFVLATYQHLQSKYGFVPNSWEVMLEPDNALWSSTQVAEAIKAAGDLLKANDFTPNFVAPSTVNTGNASSYIDRIAQTPGAMQYVSEFSYHRYSGDTVSAVQNIASRALTHNKKTSMLEWIGADYHTLHEDLKIGRNSSWQQYTLAYPIQDDNGAQYYLINDSNPNNPTITMGSRTKFLRQYFKFIRSGARRIEAQTASGKFDPLAFINSNGKYVVVVKASAAGSFAVQGLPAGTYGIKYTTESQYDVDLTDTTLSAGQPLNAAIPAAGVITVYAK